MQLVGTQQVYPHLFIYLFIFFESFFFLFKIIYNTEAYYIN